MKYQSRPLEVEAIQWTGDLTLAEALQVFVETGDGAHFFGYRGNIVVIYGPGAGVAAQQTVHPGDWIIKGPTGDIYAIPDAKFTEIYEPLDAGQRTSAEVASIAARAMRDPLSLTPDEIQSIAGSALIQARKIAALESAVAQAG